ncbi:MAG: rRNA maturation RNase YbeY [Solirubrobacteraceae bacterium]
MLDVEVFGAELAPRAPTEQEIRGLCSLATGRMGIEHAHVAIEFVDAARIAQLNAEHRGKPSPTDVLSFPIDGVEDMGASTQIGDAAELAGERVPRELGDIVICPEHTADLSEAIVHGMLHLLGLDHESDAGEMLALQDELLAAARR